MIENLFTVKIAIGEVENKDINRLFEEDAYNIKKQIVQNNVTEWNGDTFSTLGYKLQPDENMTKLLEHISQSVYELADKTDFAVELKDFWFNVASPGQFQEFHTHENCHYSFVYYVKAPENSGDISFFNPIRGDYTPDFDTGVAKNFTPKEGMFIVFRSNLMHMVKKNLSDQDRISISGNFIVK